ncbi:hypothetical protein E2C01_004176 [Portunus trituberculatus]|uniref:Uncharacterized protein n=1 Tax=Portunus trituberculatus TaxID=210409 RepID=A0A5B7CPX1_PORTR|nr:hypothetical protein [Portunus trituberculatus]
MLTALHFPFREHPLAPPKPRVEVNLLSYMAVHGRLRTCPGQLLCILVISAPCPFRCDGQLVSVTLRHPLSPSVTLLVRSPHISLA